MQKLVAPTEQFGRTGFSPPPILITIFKGGQISQNLRFALRAKKKRPGHEKEIANWTINKIFYRKIN